MTDDREYLKEYRRLKGFSKDTVIKWCIQNKRKADALDRLRELLKEIFAYEG